MAAPSGCSLPRSSEPARSRTSATDRPAAGVTLTTEGRPSVSVPVLSSTTAVTRWAVSSASPPRMMIPASAPRPVPTMMAVGVARPMAHGQAMTRTAMNEVSAKVRLGSGPATNQTTNVSAARPRTIGTKTAAMRSARRAMGALEPWARWTRSTIRARAVSRPTRVARMTKLPVPLSDAPMTSSPGPTSTGIGSPVSIDRSTLEPPSTTEPSTGTVSPGRTRSRSPTATASRATSRSSPPTTSRAVFGLEPDEPPDRAGCPDLGPGLQPPAEQDEPDDDGRRVEVGDGLDAGRRHAPPARASRRRCSPRPRSCPRRPACPCSSSRDEPLARPAGRTGGRPRPG